MLTSADIGLLRGEYVHYMNKFRLFLHISHGKAVKEVPIPIVTPTPMNFQGRTNVQLDSVLRNRTPNIFSFFVKSRTDPELYYYMFWQVNLDL